MQKPDAGIKVKIEIDGKPQEIDLTKVNLLSLEETIAFMVDKAFSDSGLTVEERKADLRFDINAICHFVGEVLSLQPMKCANGYTQHFYNNMLKNQKTQKTLLANGTIKVDVQQKKEKK